MWQARADELTDVTSGGSATLVPPQLHQGRRLWTWADPEWVLFEAVLLLPSLLCLLLRDFERAVIVAKLALYLGTVKWLGWAILTRPSTGHLRYLLFPAELVVGLTVAVAWFYLRNVLGWLVPGSYSLRELGLLPWLVATLQLAGIALARVRRNQQDTLTWTATTRELLPRVCLYAGFTLTLAVTLGAVVDDLSVPSQDGWFHSFIARVYLNDGLFYPHFNGGRAIFYPSGFGAVNATTAAISGLTVVQVQNVQHILLTVVGLYLVTTIAAVIANRSLTLFHFAPLVFLSLYPVHNLPPDVHWTHGPQQAASSLLVAIPLMSLVLPVTRRRALYAAVAVQAFLSLVVLALNPLCGLFLPIACTAALVITCYRARKALATSVWRIAAIQAGLVLAAALLVLGADRYYSTLLLNPQSASYMGGSDYGGNEQSKQPPPWSLSVGKGLSSLAATEPLNLLADWPGEEPDEIPWRRLPWLAVALTVLALGVTVRHVRGPTRTLAFLAIAFVVCDMVVKYMVSFLFGVMSNPSGDAALLRAYLSYLPPRLELWLLFTTVITSAVSVHVSARGGADRIVAVALLCTILITLIVWWWPYLGVRLDPRRNQLVARSVAFSGRITTDDIELVSWIERHIGPKQGIIGLTSLPFKLSSTKVIMPFSGAQALSLYGKHYNFTFQLFDPSREYGFDDYSARIANYFDAEWCLKNNIRFFYLPNEVHPNHGLKRAREIGLLHPIRTVSSSGLYEVLPPPWTPVPVSIPATPTSSHQVNWQADGSGVITGNDPQVVFALDTPQFVHAVRFKYKFDNTAHAPAPAQLFWKRAGQTFVEPERMASLRLEPGSQEETLTILIHDTLDEFRFDPDLKPGTFSIRELELLVRPSDGPGQLPPGAVSNGRLPSSTLLREPTSLAPFTYNDRRETALRAMVHDSELIASCGTGANLPLRCLFANSRVIMLASVDPEDANSRSKASAEATKAPGASGFIQIPLLTNPHWMGDRDHGPDRSGQRVARPTSG